MMYLKEAMKRVFAMDIIVGAASRGRNESQ
jgi:hypothetical protein